MIRRAFLLSLAVIALMAGPVAAQEEYDGTTASGSVQADGDIVVSGSGFNPNATVDYTVTLNGTQVLDGSVQADAAGDVNFTVEYQGDGNYTINMTDGENTQVLNVTVDRETDGTAATAGSLPTTGSGNSISLTQVGISFLMIGGVAVYAAKRRRSKAFA